MQTETDNQTDGDLLVLNTELQRNWFPIKPCMQYNIKIYNMTKITYSITDIQN